MISQDFTKLPDLSLLEKRFRYFPTGSIEDGWEIGKREIQVSSGHYPN